jgi:hypothetical protein
MIPWNVEVASHVPNTNYPALLKAPLGSGGNSLYFVYSAEDVVEVAKNHAKKALEEENFMNGLIKDYGHAPTWTLQHIVVLTLYTIKYIYTHYLMYILYICRIVFVYLEIRNVNFEFTS